MSLPLGQALRAVFKPVHDDPQASAALEDDLWELADMRKGWRDG